jgi:hypothetical protein
VTTLPSETSYSVCGFQRLLDGWQVAYTLQHDVFEIREPCRQDLAVFDRHDRVAGAVYDQATH